LYFIVNQTESILAITNSKGQTAFTLSLFKNKVYILKVDSVNLIHQYTIGDFKSNNFYNFKIKIAKRPSFNRINVYIETLIKDNLMAYHSDGNIRNIQNNFLNNNLFDLLVMKFEISGDNLPMTDFTILDTDNNNELSHLQLHLNRGLDKLYALQLPRVYELKMSDLQEMNQFNLNTISDLTLQTTTYNSENDYLLHLRVNHAEVFKIENGVSNLLFTFEPHDISTQYSGYPTGLTQDSNDEIYLSGRWENTSPAPDPPGDFIYRYDGPCRGVTEIPDLNFEQALINLGIDSNGLNGRILNSDICEVESLILGGLHNINSIVGIEGFINLKTLIIVQESQLTSVDLSGNGLLEYLRFEEIGIQTLDLTNNPMLNYVRANHNNLTSIDVSNCLLLETLRIHDNYFTNIDVTQNVILKNLLCSNNNLSSIDVSTNVLLAYFSCFANNLDELNVSTNLELQALVCRDNNLISLDLTVNTNLTNFDGQNNRLVNLDLRNGNNTILTYMKANDNNLVCIKVDDAVASDAYAMWYKDASTFYTESNSCAPLPKNNVLPITKEKNPHIDKLKDMDSTKFSIYPNPAKAILSINALDLIENDVTIQIYNSLGKLVKVEEYKVENNNFLNKDINISKLVNGTYFIRIVNQSKTIFTKTFIKQ
jgi:hypothetical protein